MGDNFAKNTTILAIGNVISQAISIALIALVTRIYTAEEFGEYSIIAAIAMTLIPISSLRFHAAILLPKSSFESRGLVLISLLASIIVTAFLSILVLMLGDEITALADFSNVTIVYWLPVIVMIGGWQLIFEAVALREKTFKSISIAGILSVTVDRLTSIFAGMALKLDALGLLFGRVAGLFINVALLVFGIRLSKRGGPSVSGFTVHDGIKLCEKYKSFPVFSSAAMLQQLSKQAPIILLGMFYSPLIAGFYALSFRVLAEPVHIIGAALGRSFAQRAAEYKSKGVELSEMSLKLFKYMLTLIVVPMTILAIIAPDLFVFIFGDQWHESGRYVQYIAPVFMLTFVFRSMGALFDVLRKQKDQFIYSLTLVFVSFASFSLGMFGIEIEVVLVIYSLSAFSIMAYRIIWFLVIVGVQKREIIKAIRSIFLDLMVFVLPFFIVVYFVLENILAIFLLSVVCVLMYFITCVYRDPYLKQTLRLLIAK